MPVHYTLRLQFSPQDDPDIVTQEILDVAGRGGVDEVMFFYFAEELNNGHETLKEVQAWADRSRPYRDALKNAGVAVSLNPWHSILHVDRNRQLKDGQGWQVLVDPTGRAAEVCVCPLDESWRSYFAETLRIYGKEGFRVVWIDDDFRLHNHGDLEWGGCFCPLHMKAFEQRKGICATREELVRACTAPGEPHPWREAWLDLWDETQTELLVQWRDLLAEYGVVLGLMTSMPEHHAAEGRRWSNWWHALAGDDKGPAVRPHFWPYADITPDSLAETIVLADQNQRLLPPSAENAPEIDLGFSCFPWHRSCRQVFAEISLAVISGAKHLNITAHEMIGNLPSDSPGAAEFLGRSLPTFNWLSDLFPPQFRTTGIGLPWTEEMGRTIRTEGSGKWDDLLCPSRGWASWLGPCGFSCCAASGAVVALAGPIVWTFSDEQLLDWLSGGLLLDGEAAHILMLRGWGELIGVREGGFLTQQEALYSVECCTDEAFGLRLGGRMNIDGCPHTNRMFQAEWVKSANEVSEIQSPQLQRVGHGMMLYENDRGGRVGIVPWIVHGGAHADVSNQTFGVHIQMTTNRQRQLHRAIQWLDKKGNTGWVEGGPWVIPQFLTDGKTLRSVIWNAGPDAIETCRVHAPRDMPRAALATHVDGLGHRSPVTLESDQLVLCQPLYQWEYIVLHD